MRLRTSIGKLGVIMDSYFGLLLHLTAVYHTSLLYLAISFCCFVNGPDMKAESLWIAFALTVDWDVLEIT
jgi:hypothetical protein